MNEAVGSGECAQFTPEGYARHILETYKSKRTNHEERTLWTALEQAIVQIDFMREPSATHVRISQDEYLTLLRRDDLILNWYKARKNSCEIGGIENLSKLADAEAALAQCAGELS